MIKIGETHFNLGNNDEAISYFRKLDQTKPNQFLTKYWIGKCLERA